MQVEILLASLGITVSSQYGAVVTSLRTMDDERLTWERADSCQFKIAAHNKSNENERSEESHIGAGIFQHALQARTAVQFYARGK